MQIVFEGTVGTPRLGDIALDDITIVSGPCASESWVIMSRQESNMHESWADSEPCAKESSVTSQYVQDTHMSLNNMWNQCNFNLFSWNSQWINVNHQRLKYTKHLLRRTKEGEQIYYICGNVLNWSCWEIIQITQYYVFKFLISSEQKILFVLQPYPRAPLPPPLGTALSRRASVAGPTPTPGSGSTISTSSGFNPQKTLSRQLIIQLENRQVVCFMADHMQFKSREVVFSGWLRSRKTDRLTPPIQPTLQ